MTMVASGELDDLISAGEARMKSSKSNYLHQDSGLLGFSISEDGTPLIAGRSRRGGGRPRWQEVKSVLYPPSTPLVDEEEDTTDEFGGLSTLKPASQGDGTAAMSEDVASIAATGASIHSEKSLAETVENNKDNQY